MDTESRARAYFARFTGADAASVISALPSSQPKAFEDEWLDFKSGKATKDDIPKIWSKALGAFSNNEGGVILWGIEAKKLDGVDAAHAVEPVEDVEKLVTNLMELFRFSTDPPLSGVEITPIPMAKGRKEGFVVCFIPEGALKPYRSEQAEKRFFLRMGDSSKEPTVAILRQLFYPKINQRLKVALNLGKGEGNMDVMHLAVENAGSQSVLDLYLDVRCKQTNLIYQRGGKGEQVYGLVELSHILHPGMGDHIAFISIGHKGFKGTDWTITLFARDMPAKRAELHYGDQKVTAECS
jgi:hypothetical protein